MEFIHKSGKIIKIFELSGAFRDVKEIRLLKKCILLVINAYSPENVQVRTVQLELMRSGIYLENLEMADVIAKMLKDGDFKQADINSNTMN